MENLKCYIKQVRGITYRSGEAIKKKEDGYLPVLRSNNIKNGKLNFDNLVYVPKEKIKNHQFLRKGDILITSSTGSLKVIGKNASVEENYQGSFGAFCKVVRPSEKVNPDYLKHFFQSNYYKTTIKNVTNGANINNIKTEDIDNLKIPLPSLKTQLKIAAILDEADRFRQLDKQLIQKYEDLSQSLFLEMFGDPVSNPKNWEKVKMGELMKIVRGGSPRPIQNFLGGEYPWIKIGDATKGNDIYLKGTREHIIEEGLKKTRLLPKGSLIFANCGVSLGFSRIITFEGCIHDGWLAFSELNENLNEIFLLKALNSITKYFRDTAPDGTQPNLNTTIMKNFEIILPPIEHQAKFKKELLLLEDQKIMAKKNSRFSHELFDSLLQKAFKGELVE